ncbi:MAG: hypothetical protein H7145_13615 [Akkermansiaceae bacterium]|nr:hypothetical protein [Armatimonadota bacterium]
MRHRKLVSSLLGTAGIILVAVSNALAQGTIKVSNESTPPKDGTYSWIVRTFAEGEVRDRIRSVTYTLHPSFYYPVQVLAAASPNLSVGNGTNLQKNFAYKSSGWGQFWIKVDVLMADGTREVGYHYLDLEKRKSDSSVIYPKKLVQTNKPIKRS